VKRTGGWLRCWLGIHDWTLVATVAGRPIDAMPSRYTGPAGFPRCDVLMGSDGELRCYRCGTTALTEKES
jgi:hypothetical protein